MAPRLFDLQRRLARARAHVAYCRRELARFDSTVDPYGGCFTGRARDRLAEDLRKAELDAAWAEVSLADATAPTEVPA